MYDIQNTDALPPVVKHKPREQQEAFIKAFNSAMLKGLTNDEALVSGTSAMAILAKRNSSVNKANYSAKSERKRPSHLPDIELIKALREEQAHALLEEEIEKQRINTVGVPSYLGKALPQGKTRNVIAANFDSQDRFVILFDTGEQLISKSMAIKEFVEQYVSVSMKAAEAPPIVVSPGDFLYQEYALSGLSKNILATEHLLQKITSYYIINNTTGSEVSVAVVIDISKNITINSNIILSNHTLYLTGIAA